jgi:hypothetical protein
MRHFRQPNRLSNHIDRIVFRLYVA